MDDGLVGSIRRGAQILWKAYRLWLRHDCMDLSAAFAYHTLQSLFPALLIALALASRWLGGDRLLMEKLLNLLFQWIPVSSHALVADAFMRFLRQGTGAGLVGFGLLLFSANNIYLSLQRGADRIWWNRPHGLETLSARDVVLRFLRLRLKAFALLLLIGPLLVLDQWVGKIRFLGIRFFYNLIDPGMPQALRGAGSVSVGLDLLLSIMTAILVILLLLWWLPSSPIALRPLLPAAILVGIAITVLNMLLGRTLLLIGLRFQAYGVVGAILLLSLWVWLVGVIFYYGQCLAVVLGRVSRGRRSALL